VIKLGAVTQVERKIEHRIEAHRPPAFQHVAECTARPEPDYAAGLLNADLAWQGAGTDPTSEGYMEQHTVAWEVCGNDDCIGVRLPTSHKCWAHADDLDLNAALKQLRESGRLDARGVPFTADLLQRVLAAAFHDDQGCAVIRGSRFDQATFHGDARFGRTIFEGDTRFEKATFRGEAQFGGSIFQGEAIFIGATFEGDAWLTGMTFQGEAQFDGTTFHGDAYFGWTTFQYAVTFGEATFHQGAMFGQVTFQHAALFEQVTFHGDAHFGWATFKGAAVFRWAIFQRDAGFGQATIQYDAVFEEATFQRARQLGPMLVRKGLILDDAVFEERAQIEVSAAACCCRRTRFLAGVQLRMRWAQVVLDDADLAAPSILTGVPAFPDLEEGHLTQVWQRLRAANTRGSQPRLVSLRRADVAGLTVAGVDLRACRFAGAHHLDQLRVEESAFAFTPKCWRWTTRQTIAEEHHWRATFPYRGGQDSAPRVVSSNEVSHSAGWYGRVHQPPAWLKVEPLTAAQIAALYRALRKGREDNKDEPGAADLYYGEMEMRRHDSTKPKAERFVLLLYWLFSGYALRASRAFAWILGIIAVATMLLATVGLEQPVAAPVMITGTPPQLTLRIQALTSPSKDWSLPTRLGTAALVALEGAVFRASEQQLTYKGRLIQTALRLVGPVLLGLALLSIRGRVKR